MSDVNGFTVKEMLVKIDVKLDTFIAQDAADKIEIDKRFDHIEKKDAERGGSIKTILWIISFLGAGGVAALLKVFIL